MKKATVYLDTSVINFLFADDAPELKQVTEEFFETTVKLGLMKCCISEYVLAEINQTKDENKRVKLLNVISEYNLEIIEITLTQEIEELAEKYLNTGIIPEKKIADALHVAVVTVMNIDYLASWNYKHLANVNKEAKILNLNFTLNYHHNLRLVTPSNLLGNEND